MAKRIFSAAAPRKAHSYHFGALTENGGECSQLRRSSTAVSPLIVNAVARPAVTRFIPRNMSTATARVSQYMPNRTDNGAVSNQVRLCCLVFSRLQPNTVSTTRWARRIRKVLKTEIISLLGDIAAKGFVNYG